MGPGAEEVTEEVMALYEGGAAAISPGDLFVVVVDGNLLFSFHGDTNGLASVPTVNAVVAYAKASRPECQLLGGVDANTHEGKGAGTSPHPHKRLCTF